MGMNGYSALGLVAIALTIMLFIRRKCSWVPVVWLPVFVTSGYFSLRILTIIFAHRSGMEALSGLFTLLFGWPWLVAFIGAIISFPRSWNPKSTAIGSILTLLLAVGFLLVTTENQEVQLIDVDGTYIPNFTCNISTTEDGITSGIGSQTTNSKGQFSFWYNPKNNYTSLKVDRSQKYYTAELRIDSSIRSDDPHQRRVILYWGVPGSSEFSQCSSYTFQAKSEALPFYQKRLDTLINKSLQKKLRSLLRNAKANGIDPQVLAPSCRNPESLDLIDDIAQIIPHQPNLRPSAIFALQYVSETLSNLHNISKTLIKKGPYKQFDPREKQMYSALCSWSGVSPNDDRKKLAAAINAKIRGYADQLISASQSNWTEENHSVFVVRELGELGRPAIPLLAAAFPNACQRAREAMLESLWNLHPTISELDWFTSNNDPVIVAAAYHAVEDYISKDDLPLAIERLRKIEQPNSDTPTQLMVSHLLATFGEKLNKE